MATKAELMAEVERLQYIRDAQIEQIAEQSKKITQLEQEIKRLQSKSVKHKHNERGAGRKSIDKQLVKDIQKLINEGMTMKHISEILNVSVGTVHKYSKVK